MAQKTQQDATSTAVRRQATEAKIKEITARLAELDKTAETGTTAAQIAAISEATAVRALLQRLESERAAMERQQKAEMIDGAIAAWEATRNAARDDLEAVTVQIAESAAALAALCDHGKILLTDYIAAGGSMEDWMHPINRLESVAREAANRWANTRPEFFGAPALPIDDAGPLEEDKRAIKTAEQRLVDAKTFAKKMRKGELYEAAIALVRQRIDEVGRARQYPAQLHQEKLERAVEAAQQKISDAQAMVQNAQSGNAYTRGIALRDQGKRELDLARNELSRSRAQSSSLTEWVRTQQLEVDRMLRRYRSRKQTIVDMGG